MGTRVEPFQHNRHEGPPLHLPPPRVWSPQDLARFLGVSVSWVYKRTQADAEDPIPRVPGVGRLRFDTCSPHFQGWMRRQLGYVDAEEGGR